MEGIVMCCCTIKILGLPDSLVLPVNKNPLGLDFFGTPRGEFTGTIKILGLPDSLALLVNNKRRRI